MDGRSFVGDEASGLRRPRGVARYAASLLGALAEAHPEDDWRLLVSRDAAVAAPEGVQQVKMPLPGRLAHAAAAVGGRPRLDRLLGGGLDVVWLPAPAPVAISASVPFVLTVHDLATELRPRDFTRYARLWNRVTRPRRLARRAARVLFDSAATRDQALLRWGAGARPRGPGAAGDMAPGRHTGAAGRAPA